MMDGLEFVGCSENHVPSIGQFQFEIRDSLAINGQEIVK